MARPPLPVGTWGDIGTHRHAPKLWRARTRVRDNDGVTRQVMRSGTSESGAKQALLEHLRERTKNGGVASSDSVRFAQWCNEWHSAKHTWAINTERRYREVLDSYVIPNLGGLYPRELTVARLDAFLDQLTDDIGAPTAKLARTVLKGALNLVVRRGVLPTNPINDTAPVVVTHKKPVALDLAHLEAIRAAFAERERPREGSGRPILPGLACMVEVMIGTGLRIGEVLAVRWSDLDLEAGTVYNSGTAVKGPDGKWMRQDHPKTKGSQRVLHMPTFAVDALKAHQGKLPPNTLDLVFPSAAGTVRDPHNVRKTWAKACADLGLPQGTTPHAFRRTVATYVDEHLGLDAASKQLGHRDRATTQRHYVEMRAVAPDVTAVLNGLAPAGMP